MKAALDSNKLKIIANLCIRHSAQTVAISKLKYGIPKDDFDTFAKKRAAAFINEIKARLVVTSSDAIDTEIKHAQLTFI